MHIREIPEIRFRGCAERTSRNYALYFLATLLPVKRSLHVAFFRSFSVM